ncbi:MAG TPA: hypothetical protein VKH42_19755, partial [Vicinamibacterales bacterium]|nr:hypothetical protein [Vicinamibacterales bacterium]
YQPGSPMNTLPFLAMFGVIVVLLVLLMRGVMGTGSGARRSRGPGAGASGAVYDMLNEDKRNAVEIIVEERAGARDPEDRDGNLPDLSKSRLR